MTPRQPLLPAFQGGREAQVPHPAWCFGVGEDESEARDLRPSFATLETGQNLFRTMDKANRPYFSNLKCRECGKLYEKKAIHVCEFDFGPLEAAYDYDAIKAVISRKVIESRPQSMWRYRELLPI